MTFKTNEVDKTGIWSITKPHADVLQSNLNQLPELTDGKEMLFNFLCLKKYYVKHTKKHFIQDCCWFGEISFFF